jgi:hypothetical protein
VVHGTRRATAWLCTVVASIMAAHFVAGPAYACLGGYRGPDWQVGNSPLIVIGTIEKVEAGKVTSAKKHRASFESGGGESHRVPPTIATVRITRVLKGKYADAHIRIGGGPIHNSCDADWFYALKVGDQKIFILPYYPVDGEVALEWHGSMLKLVATSMIESRIARAVKFRDTHLARIRSEQPKVYAAGTQLGEDLRKAAKTWPEMNWNAQTGKPSDLYETALADLTRKLAKFDIETIRTALAIDWPADGSNPWWRNRLWKEALSEVSKSRIKEIDAVEDRWIRETLNRARVEERHIDEYLAALKKATVHGSLCFPYEPSSDWGFFHRDYAGGRGVLSTDLILRCHSYDRGAMLHAYAGTLDSSVLANIDPKRVKPWVASLNHSDDERLRWIAQRIIAQTPGADFADLVRESHPDPKKKSAE